MKEQKEEPLDDLPLMPHDNENVVVEAEQLMLFADSTAIKEEPVEIKEEPFDDFADLTQGEPSGNVSGGTSNEFKKEPIDELADFKQEEPIADMFCPSTRNSRPHNASNTIINGNGIGPFDLLKILNPNDAKQKCDFCTAPHYPIRYSPMIPVKAKQYFEKFIELTPENRTTMHRILSQGYTRAKICTKHFRIMPMNLYSCDLCGEQTNIIVNSPIGAQARPFFDKLMISSAQRSMSGYFIGNNLRATICSIHVRTSTFSSDEEDEESIQLKKALAIPVNFKPKFNRQYFSKQYCPSTGSFRDFEYPTMIDDSFNTVNRYTTMRTCDLCREKTSSYTVSPINEPSRIRRLCESLIEAVHRKKIEIFAKHKFSSVVICFKHFKTSQCDGRQFTVHKLAQKNTPKCILCEMYPSSVRGYIAHLHRHNKSTLTTNDIYLKCNCGYEILSDIRPLKAHNKACDGRQFTLHKLKAKETPKCILCEKFPSTASGYAQHLNVRHKSTLKALGIYLKCACSIEVTNHSSHVNYSKECDGRQFTLHKIDEK